MSKQMEFEFVEFTKGKEKITIREVLADRFKSLEPHARLLAVHLDGFSHKAFIDDGRASSSVQCIEYSGCMPGGKFPNLARAMFHDIGHAGYQGAPREIVYILPNDR